MSNKDNNPGHDQEQKRQDNMNPEADGMEIMDNVAEAAEEDETAEDIENAEMSEIDALTKQLAEEKLKLEKEKKEYMFLMADFDNFRKRTLKEKSEIIRNGAESAMKGLLPIIDDFERGIQASASTDDPEAIRQGMVLIYQKFVKYLEQNGVKAIESTGTEFNPDIHEAIAMVPVTDEEQKGKVIDTPSKGYMINDKVLRHAKVAVGQ
ncbi:MAG: nucleotide exchange factor GrpE [Bacteroides sp.]|nr:nucleotide exchange factor GrpE [Barnesiella sp.]MBD5324106.1 nucleotide exchange factor GrpE [Bacteroides sp.]MDE7460491.1 nucleotide exchange factor GrpE [Paramuribaculum sp.]